MTRLSPTPSDHYRVRAYHSVIIRQGFARRSFVGFLRQCARRTSSQVCRVNRVVMTLAELSLAQVRSPAHLVDLMRNFWLILLKMLTCQLRNVHLAEDLAQETILQFLKKKPDRNDSSWMKVVATNKGHKSRRKMATESNVIAYLNNTCPKSYPDSQSEGIELSELKGLIQAAIEGLPDGPRTVATSYYLGLSLPEIADLLGLPLGRVNYWWAKARKQLARDLKKFS